MKTTKSFLAILLVCCIVLSWGGTAFAAKESVNADGADISADFVTVTDVEDGSEDARALSILAVNGGSADVSVSEDVTAEAVDGAAVAVSLHTGTDSEATLSVEGNVEAVSSNNQSSGVAIGMGDGDIAVSVGGDISSTGCDVATGLSSGYTGGTVTAEIGGDVSAVGDYNAEGVDVQYAIDTAISVDGNVSADAGEGNAYGVSVATKEGATGTPSEVAVEVGGDVHAKSDDAAADGVNVIAMEGSDVQIDVGGSVSAFADNIDPADVGERAAGISIHAATDGAATVTVEGDVEATSVDNRSFGVNIGMGDGDVAVKVGGDVTSTGSDVAVGLSSGYTGGTVTAEVGGDITAVGEYNACGVDVQLAIDTTITVEGDVSAQAEVGNTDGVFVYSHKGVDQPSEITVEVGGDVSAESQGGSASGVTAIADEGAAIDVKVCEDVSATSNNSGASAVLIQSNEGGEVTVEVGGNATAQGSFNVFGLELYATGGRTEASLGGDVTANGASDAIGAQVISDGGGDADVSLSGSIGAQSKIYSIGVNVTANNDSQADVSVDGDISAESEYHAYGVTATVYEDESEATLSIAGNVTAQSDRSAIGVGVSAYNGSEAAVTIEGDIDAKTTDGNRNANGIFLNTKDSDITADITGNVSSSGNGIVVSGACFSNEDPAEGSVTLVMTGDVTAGEYALVRMNDEASSAMSDIVIDGTLHGESGGVLVSENITEDNLKLTVWKIDLDEEENAIVTAGESGEKLVTDNTKALEDSIHYIIKVEQTEGADIGLLGTNKRTVQDKTFDEAMENDVVTMMISLADGYMLNGAFNGLGEKVPLLIDEDGNYYVIVPRGGGVYLSASVVKIQEPVYNSKRQTAKATISFELGGGTLDGDEGPILVKAKVGKTIQLLDAPERDGFRFVCWNLEVPDGDPVSYDPGDSFKVEGDAVFTAVWEENT